MFASVVYTYQSNSDSFVNNGKSENTEAISEIFKHATAHSDTYRMGLRIQLIVVPNEH